MITRHNQEISMSKDRTTPGEKTTNRLMDRNQLKRVNVPGGGEAFQGPTATRALKALGARAMTLDQSIVVGEDFDPNRPEDAALYAHEKLHVDRGGTAATHAVHDAEEVSARAAEEMVLHRMAMGESAQQVNRSKTPQEAPTPTGGSPTARAVGALKAQGQNHQDMVENLAQKVVDRLSEEEERTHNRGANAPGTKRF
jgi:hypothetical protein